MPTEELRGKFLQALLRGDRRACAQVVDRLIDGETPLKTIYEDFFQSALYRVGDLWERNQCSVATEHCATAIVESLMVRTYPGLFRGAPSERRAVVACTANEHHQVGAKMAADMLEMEGWDVGFVGANTPVDALLSAIAEKRPHVVGLSLSVYFNMPNLMETLQSIRLEHPGLPVLVGGQAFRHGGREQVEAVSGVTVVKNLDALRELGLPSRNN